MRPTAQPFGISQLSTVESHLVAEGPSNRGPVEVDVLGARGVGLDVGGGEGDSSRRRTLLGQEAHGLQRDVLSVHIAT